MHKVALIIIYNHQYNKNIEIIEEIYGERFSAIYHLVPFYSGEKPNVIPIYENSLYFQGYVAQGLKIYFKETYNHYFFIADDLMLNPIINENNYMEYFDLDKHSCFLPYLLPLHKHKNGWPRIYDAFHYCIKVDGVETENQLPNYESAIQKIEIHGLQIKPLKFDQIYAKTTFPTSLNDSSLWTYCKLLRAYFLYNIRRLKNRNKAHYLSYPLIGNYSDIFIVNAADIKQFCHYCGVFAATRLHVEIAMPTSMVLSAEKIVTEKNLTLKGKALWTKDDYQILNKYKNSLSLLMADFPKNLLYLHPVKLSKWEK